MADKVINETDLGTLTHIGNEVLNYSKVDDPAAYRGGAPSSQRSLVKFSGDVLNEHGKGHEVVLMQFKQSGDGVPDGQRGGEFYLGLGKPGAGSTDGAMLDVLVATPAGFEFMIPIYAPNLGGAAGHSDTMWSPNGLSFTQQQNDGNFVTYTTTVPFSKAGNHVTAVWSAWTGKL